jgi:hypothetical protein
MSNGLTKPSEIFRREIEPALDDYLAHPLDERLANNIARAIDHFADWTFKYHKEVDPSRLSGATDEKSFRAQLLPQCPELQMMNDLSDAAHHRFLNRPNNPERVVTESTAAYSVQNGQLYVPKYGKEFGPSVRIAANFWRHWQD